MMGREYELPCSSKGVHCVASGVRTLNLKVCYLNSFLIRQSAHYVEVASQHARSKQIQSVAANYLSTERNVPDAVRVWMLALLWLEKHPAGWKLWAKFWK